MSLVLFDLDNTLLDRAGAFRAWAAAFCQQHDLPAGALEWLVDEDRDGQRSREDFFAAVRSRFALGSSPETLIADYRDRYPLGFRLAPDTRGALERLRAGGRRLAIVTNGPATQEEKIRLTGLDQLVDGWCTSELVGVRKPDRGIFEMAARRAGGSLDPGTWMVGDHPEADVGGAHAAGLRSVWIHRGRSWTIDAYRPTLIASDVAEASELIERGRHCRS